MSIAERAQRVHKKATVIDMMEVISPGFVIGVNYFKTLMDAGVTAIHIAMPHDDSHIAITKIAKLYRTLEQAPNAVLATTVADIQNAKKEGKAAVIVGLQDGAPFEKDLDLLRVFYKLGVRVVQLAITGQNYFGTGAFKDRDGGLSELGREAVKELNRLGILIDISHCGTKTATDIMEASKYSVAFTHAVPSKLVEMGARAKSDELLQALGEKGGVVGQMIWSPFCERRDKMGIRPTLDDFVELLAHMANVAGVEHVGLGLDAVPFFTEEFYSEWAKGFGPLMRPHKTPTFEEKYVAGFNDITDMPKITQKLLKHGYSEEETRKIMGENWVSLLSKVWK